MNRISTTAALAAALFLSAHAAAQCTYDYRLNFAGTGTTDDDVCLQRTFVFTNPEPFPIRVCQASVRIRNGGCSSAMMRIEVRDDLTAWGYPGPVQYTSPTLAIPATLSTVTAVYTNDVVLQPGERRHFAINYMGTNPCGVFLPDFVDKPAATSGTPVESWIELEQSGVTFWIRSDEPVMYRIDYMPWIAAKRQTIGSGCGVVAPCSSTPARSINWNGNPPNGNLLATRHAFHVDDAFGYPARDVCGLDLRMSAQGSTAQPVRVTIHDDENTLPGSILAETTIMVPPGSPSLLHVAFPAPARIQAADDYWIAFELLGGPVIAPTEAFGNPVTAATWVGAGWFNNGPYYNWATRIYWSTAPSQVPRLNGERAILGQDFT
ncbi:MAG: hypothetical protein KAI24_19355, partial [Planctomycetes bacterium]|nr:hypothetical protein [Planctomycetota bacterium]